MEVNGEAVKLTDELTRAVAVFALKFRPSVAAMLCTICSIVSPLDQSRPFHQLSATTFSVCI